MDGPDVSTIIPVYNREEKIERAIRSACNQTHPVDEIIVVDDNSADKTVQRVQEIEDPRIELVELDENKGPGEARNIGIRKSEGDIIAFLDSDDFWHPEKNETQLHRVRSLPEDYGLFYTGAYVIEDSVVRPRTPNVDGDIQREELVEDQIPGTSAVMVRRRALDSLEYLFNPDIPAREDYELWIRLTRDWKIGGSREPLAAFDRGSSNRVSEDWESHIEAQYQIMELVRQECTDSLEINIDAVMASHFAYLAMIMASKGRFKEARSFSLEAIRRDALNPRRVALALAASFSPTYRASKSLQDSLRKWSYEGIDREEGSIPKQVFGDLGENGHLG